jgi:hypothetical protein
MQKKHNTIPTISNSSHKFQESPFPANMQAPASLQHSLDNTKVEYVQLGKSGLRVSSPILGTMAIGSKTWGLQLGADWVIGEEEGLQLLKAAWDRGKSSCRMKTS